MARGSLSKVRWRNDRVRKTKARRRRHMAAGKQRPAAPATEETTATPPR